MKVLMFATDRNIFKEGSEVRRRMIDYGKLVEEIHAVVFSRRSDNLAPLAVAENVRAYPTNSLSRWCYLFDAYRAAKKIIAEAPGRRLISCQDPFETGLAGYWLKRKFGLPLQLQIHTDFLSPHFARESTLNKIRVLIAKFLLPKADCVRVVSERIKNSLVAAGFSDRNVFILPIFTDEERISAPPKFNLRRKYPRFRRIILAVSRLSKEKNVGLAIAVMEEVAKRRAGVGFIVVGDGPELGFLKSRVEERELGESVVFEGRQEDLSSYYHGADVFLHTANYEGYGLVLAEAALAGRPIVTTDVGIASELRRKGADVFICPAGDVQCLTGGVLKALEAEPDVSLSRVTMADKKDCLAKMKESWQKCLSRG